MSNLTLTAAAIVIAAAAFAGSDYGTPYTDERADHISQSFTRMLEHEPYYGPTADVAATPEDPLAAHVYAVLRDESVARRAVADAERNSGRELSYWLSAVGSFHRMFDHQPYTGPTSGTAPLDQDPLEVAFRTRLQPDAKNARLAAANHGSRVE